MACASTVAVVVPSPATSDVLLATSLTICAPMFSSASFSSISFATVTPSLVMVGDPKVLPRMTLRPRGPSVTLTALARLSTPRRIPCRDASPYTICFAIVLLSSRRIGLDHRQHFVLPHDEVILAIELDLLVGVLAEQDHITRLDIESHSYAALLDETAADGDHRAPLRLLFGGIRNDDPADVLLAAFETPNDDPIVERSEIHRVDSCVVIDALIPGGRRDIR